MHSLMHRCVLMFNLPQNNDKAKLQDLNNKKQVKAVLLYLLNKSVDLHI